MLILAKTLTGQKFELNFAVFPGENDLNLEKKKKVFYESPPDRYVPSSPPASHRPWLQFGYGFESCDANGPAKPQKPKPYETKAIFSLWLAWRVEPRQPTWLAAQIDTYCPFVNYSWKIPAYSAAFLLTVDNLIFFYLQLKLFCLQ